MARFNVEICSNNEFSADTFSATFALGAYPASSASFWTDSPSISLSLEVALDGTSFTELIRGTVDTVSLDIGRGLVRVEGRDLTSLFVESELAETFPNRTASEIAQLLASRHGLQSSVTPTATPVGRYYQSEHDATLLSSFSQVGTEWDLLVWLARWEGFNVFISGTTLNFNPPGLAAPTLVISPESLLSFRLGRSLVLGKNISLTVKSWNSAQNTIVVQSAQTGGGVTPPALQSDTSGALNFTIIRPNLSPDQALQLAQRKLLELTRHERIVEFTMPGDTILSPRDNIAILGTTTSFDRIFQVDFIERTLGPDGFVQRVRAASNLQQSVTAASASSAGSE